MVLAGMHGNRSIIRLLLSPLTAHLRERTELLEEAFYGAIHSGCIQTIQFILSPEFGRIGNFSGWLWEEVLWISTHYEEFLWGETPLSTGMANSASVDFCHQFYELLRSSPEPSIYNQFGDEPDLNEQLHRICTAGIQREDVTKYLLDKGATVQDTSDGTKNRVDIRGLTHERIRPERPWNPLRAAVKSGHEKIVRVLLDAGADPNKTDNDVLWVAAQSGRTDIVRLLLDHGAKVNMAPCPGGRYYTLTGWETPLLVAERSENEALCELLKSKMTAEENEAHRVGDRDSETYREWKTWIEYTYGSMEDLDETVVRNYVPKNYWDYGKII
ncbi:ankyrin [Aaosphaeria arxii CBS 175.79]|uniref:Ankyrin n=1 Tax=Aaosphaeria arxii CBS 175.79 TaxID=1450172 RepID=A0A6A5XUU1_9PLEO|nr:ankyrin [Aaosphaeria arxii CBS 175.79]KAF2016699.1 ankyrin [Aaosphaeria arxii CBS 175.79]